MEIRPYTEADLEPVVSLWMASWKSSGPTFGQWVTLDVLRERLPREIAGGWSVHVVTLGGDIVGFIACTATTVEQLFVAPALQGQGIGKVLLDFAKAQMPQGFTLTTAADNWMARQFYSREGLREGAPGIHPGFGHTIVPFEWVGALDERVTA